LDGFFKKRKISDGKEKTMTNLKTNSIQTILFDLDGTIADPKVGIIRSLGYALGKMGQPVPPEEDLLWCIGPPLLGSLEKLVGADRAETAIALYRERFRTLGKLENYVYPGIPETLESLKTKGYRLFVATSKPHVYAVEILDRFQLSYFFEKIYGPELDGTLNDKGELIAHLLKKEGLSTHETVMVGDRSFDILAAKQNGLAAIGVTYGYGSREELLDAGADEIAASPQEIPALFIP
jgi:phosphoglycolate phosphatase